ncbi:MAG: hypothetical protein GOP50_01665, partial [Candidatus Heimdallarchaeota archaeon]|nr:hypothetical protein [Candidatus Heimdallarchaeota archaeon]
KEEIIVEAKKEEIEVKKTEQVSSPKQPYASVRYPTPDNVFEVDRTYLKPAVEHSSYIPIPQIQIPKIEVEEEVDSTKESSIVQDEVIEEVKEAEKEIKVEEQPIKVDLNQDIDEDTFFLDIPRGARLIHLFGPPGSAKTTLGLQSAIEIAPKNTYYFITSHATSVIKRVKQLIDNERWNEYQSFKQSFFPIEISNLEVLESQLVNIEEMSPDEIGLVIIDHLTDYSRGQIHKEEKRKQLRNLLERLYLLADEKDCKILIINGYSYKDSAPAEDIVESFCDMTLHTIIEDRQVKLITEEEEFPLLLDDSGVRNLHVNIYY